MSEMAEDFKAFRDAGKEKRKSNLEYSTDLLIKEGINFESRNDGLHLMIETSKGRVNFYPSTGLYNGAVSGRGVRSLLKKLESIEIDALLDFVDSQFDGDDIIGFRD